MTAAQKRNQARFKAAAAEAKKLRARNPKLSQAQAVKQAWAILYKKGSVGQSHKDTKSHNVNIRVVSGVKKKAAPTRRRVGALPIGFRGKFLGWPFKILNQYTIDGGVTAQIVEELPPGDIVAELNGRPADAERAANSILSAAQATWKKDKRFNLSNKDEKDLIRRIKQFTTGLNKEVRDYNSGRDTRTVKKKPVEIKYKAATKKLALIDEIKMLLAGEKKRLKYGYKTVPGKPKIKKSDVSIAGSSLKARQAKNMQASIKRLEAELKKPGLTAAQRERLSTMLRVDQYNLQSIKKRGITGIDEQKKKAAQQALSEMEKWQQILNKLRVEYAVPGRAPYKKSMRADIQQAKNWIAVHKQALRKAISGVK